MHNLDRGYRCTLDTLHPCETLIETHTLWYPWVHGYGYSRGKGMGWMLDTRGFTPADPYAERLEEIADALYATVSDCQNTVKLLAPSLDSTQERLNLLSKQMLASPPPTHPAPLLSYSAATAAHLPSKVDHAVGRAAIRACQIILDPKPGTSLFPPGTSNKDIAAHLKEAIGNIRDDDTPPGYIRAVSALRNGGVVAELNTEELAA
jgi:hypothetical protein